MKNLLSLGILCAAVISAPLAASATTLNGSDSIALFGVTTNPSGVPLDPASGLTSISWTLGLTSNTGAGDLSPIPTGTTVSASTIFITGPDGGDGSSPFSFDITGFGTFTETSNPVVVANTINGTSSGLELYLLGTFTPSGAFAGDDTNSASFDVSFTKTGASISGSGTFATPAVPLNPVPEPSSLALLGTSILGSVGLLRRRFKA